MHQNQHAPYQVPDAPKSARSLPSTGCTKISTLLIKHWMHQNHVPYQTLDAPKSRSLSNTGCTKITFLIIYIFKLRLFTISETTLEPGQSI
jgi:hypothetical protein